MEIRARCIMLDAPLALTVGADGTLYLSLVVVPVATVRGEVPAPAGSGMWTLQRAPYAGVTCWRNGLHQLSGLHYTLAGAVLRSEFWEPSDQIVCDYDPAP